jgi:TRAP-type mannitol/chloroaromatic compound transport system permease large subunit
MYLVDLLPILMFVALGVLLFTGIPVGFILGGVGLGFGVIGYFYGVFSPVELFNINSRIYGSVADNLILTAIPMFIFMGTCWNGAESAMICSVACRCCCAVFPAASRFPSR